MDSLAGMQLALLFFGATAVGGLLMAGMRFGGRPRPPSWLVAAHGSGAALGLAILAYLAVTVGLPQQAQLALGLLALAALGGLSMNLMFHRRQRPLPKPMLIGHGLLAAIGFAVLLVEVCGTMQAA